MPRTAPRLTVLVILGFFSCVVFTPAAADSTTDEAQILEIIEAVRIGWLEADGTPFRAYFLDFEGARYIESGGQNEGLTDLVEHHVEPEADAFEGFELAFNNPEIHFENDFAWAIVNTEIRATIKRDGRVIHNNGYQTFLFRRIGDDWKVVHTHSSSRPVRK